MLSGSIISSRDYWTIRVGRCMDEQLIEGLLAKLGEDTTVDFKSKMPRLDNDHFKAKFIKDIVSLANTPRDGRAHIILGVRASSNGQKQIVGIKDHIDDAELQNLVSSKIAPVPTFLYRPIKYDGLTLGLIEIEPRMPGTPYVSTWEKRDIQTVLKYGVTYFRRGSSNSEAGQADQEVINRWMLGPDDIAADPGYGDHPAEYWDEFFEASYRFDDSRLYVLLIGPSGNVGSEILSGLSRVPWSLVVDFDTATASEGAYLAAKTEIENRRSLHLLTLEDSVPFYPERATYWIAAAGLADRPSTIVEESGWQQWNRRFARKLIDVLERFARGTAGKPVTVIVASDHLEEARIICQQLDSAIGDTGHFVFTGFGDSIAALANQFDSCCIPISLRNICMGLVRFRPIGDVSAQEMTLPTTDGGPSSRSSRPTVVARGRVGSSSFDGGNARTRHL